MIKKLTARLILSCILVLFSTGVTNAAPYEWNNTLPVKVPANPNGKIVLFDASHGGTEGNADWVIDGGFSDFADALVNQGYKVEEYRGVDLNNDGKIRYYDDLNNPANSSRNEAIITYAAIQHADVFVMAETNRPLKISEYRALEQFIAAGKGIFFIADHYNADRNLNTWDATEVFNGYNRSNLPKYNYGGAYGDLRNPGSRYGWLAQKFGVRFRFNAVDYKQGASDIAAPVNAENITQNVGPVLMAAGATLSIVDPLKAKGLVYFSASDTPRKWKHANDAGLYYGGAAEGPYVAISKAGAGKAAFIGDSSPIEDSSPKYRRQDNGRVKKTYPGFTDAGNAANLSVNIINWLATPESYTQFDNRNGHTSGTVTPTAKAPTEFNDPANGQPWSQPRNGYNPWNTDTFKNGSFGAPNALGGGNNGGGNNGGGNNGGGGNNTGTDKSVADVLSFNNGTTVQVRGVVTQGINGVYALELKDEQNASQTIYVKLERSQRSRFSPQLNPSIIGKTLRVKGTKNNYMSSPGIRNVTSIEIVSGALSVSQALSKSNGSQVIVEGIITAGLNGPYALILTDSNNSSVSINVKLERRQRSQFSPQRNPSILNHKIRVKGTRNNYMSQPGIRNVTEITDLGSSSGGNNNGGGNGSGNNQYISVSDALNTSIGTRVEAVGFVIQGINGPYGLRLQDINNGSKTINVKLERRFRNQFSPRRNPSIVGKQIVVKGKRGSYMGQPGIRHVSSMMVQ